MRRYLSVCLLAVAVLAATPKEAAAIDWYFLDSLSGPKFSGLHLEWRFVCFKEPLPENQTTRETESPGTKAAVVAFGVAGSVGPTCVYVPGQRRRGSVAIGFGMLDASAEPRFAGNEDVKLTTISPAFLWQVHDDVPLELGFGAGFYWFTSRGFVAFDRFTFQPVRLDFRPLDWGDRNKAVGWLRAAVMVKFGVNVFPRGFEARDFLDTDPEREPREIKKFIAISLDAEPILRRLTNTW